MTKFVPYELNYVDGNETVRKIPLQGGGADATKASYKSVRAEGNAILPLDTSNNSSFNEFKIQDSNGNELSPKKEEIYTVGSMLEDFNGGDLDTSNRDDFVVTYPQPNDDKQYLARTGVGGSYYAQTTRKTANFNQSSGSVNKSNSSGNLELTDTGSGIDAKIEYTDIADWGTNDVPWISARFTTSEPSSGYLQFTLINGDGDVYGYRIRANNDDVVAVYNGSTEGSVNDGYSDINWGISNLIQLKYDTNNTDADVRYFDEDNTLVEILKFNTGFIPDKPMSISVDLNNWDSDIELETLCTFDSI